MSRKTSSRHRPASARPLPGASEAAAPPDVFERQSRVQLPGRYLDRQRKRLRRRSASPTTRRATSSRASRPTATRSPSRPTATATTTSTSSPPPAASRASSPSTAPTTTSWAGPPTARTSSSHPSRGNGVFPSVATLWEVPVEGGIEQPISTDWGSSASYSPDGTKMAFTRHPGVWSRKHYRGSYAVDLWVMDVAAKKFTKLGGDPDYKGNYLWPMYARNGEIYFVAEPAPTRRAQVRRSRGDEERQQHLEDLRQGRQARQVTHPRRRQSLFPQHLGRRQDHRLRRQLRHLEARYRQREEHAKFASTSSPIPRRTTPNWSPSPKRGGFQPLAFEQRARHRGARRDLHHRHRPRRTAARYRHAWREQSPRWSPERQMDRFRFGPHRPRRSLHLRRARQERQAAERCRLRQERPRLVDRFQDR